MAVFVLTAGPDNFPGAFDNSGDDTITALAGADTVHGGLGNDLVDGGAGVDMLFGDDGDDIVHLGRDPSTDNAFGGTGLDTVVLDFSPRAARVVAQFSTGAWVVQVGGVAGPSLDGFERMQVSAGNANDLLVGGTGDDILEGNGGDDRLRGGTGADTVGDSWGVWDADGGKGVDLLRVFDSNARDRRAGLVFDAVAGTIAAGTSASGVFDNFEWYEVTGTDKADSVLTGDLGDFAGGLGGNDDITLGGGNDIADGGAGNDRIFGGLGNDTLYSGLPVATTAQARDRLFGGDGDDLFGVETHSPGASFTYQGAVFDGGAGSDTLEFETTNAVLDLSQATLSGIDRIQFSAAPVFGLRMAAAQLNGLDIDFDLNLGTLYIATGGTVVPMGDLRMARIVLSDADTALNLGFSTRTGSAFGPDVVGGAGADNIQGSDRIETFSGQGGNDILVGRGGADTLLGGDGRDTIMGDDGNDRIIGGSGGDQLFGASGGPVNKDIFVYTATTDSVVSDIDIIEDFLVAGGFGVDFIDRIDVSQIDAKASTAGNQDFGFIGTAAFTGEGQIRATQSGAATFIEFNTSGASGAEMAIFLSNFTATDLNGFDFFP